MDTQPAQPARPALSPSFRQNLMAWLVAGGLAYYLWVVPERQRNDEQERVREQAKRWAEDAAAAEAAKARR